MFVRRLGFALALSVAAAFGAIPTKTLAANDWHKPTPAWKTFGGSDSHEEELAKDIVTYYDSILLLNEQQGINYMEGTWVNDPSPTLKNLASGLEAKCAALKTFSFAEANREHARKDLIHCQMQLVADIRQMAQACHQATTNKGWDTQSTALALKAFNDSKALPTDGSIGKVIKDPSFQAYLPQMFLEANSLMPDVNGFKLGVKFLVTSSLQLVYVQPGGLASTLQLQSLDDIVDVNGQQPKDMDDFKSMIKKAAGQTITLHIKRLGITDMTYQVTVPADLKPGSSAMQA